MMQVQPRGSLTRPHDVAAQFVHDVLERRCEGDVEIARPRQLYLGSPRRDFVPIDRRPATDFLWQRSPFRLRTFSLSADGSSQDPGVDFVLPYWLARYSGAIK